MTSEPEEVLRVADHAKHAMATGIKKAITALEDEIKDIAKEADRFRECAHRNDMIGRYLKSVATKMEEL